MDEKQLEQLAKLKTMLRSLVVSSPTSMDVNNLRRDYRELMGGPLPFFELGYRDIVTFLRERCSDIFMFSGSPTNPTLVPVITDKISHIDDFVSKQKIAPHKKCKGKRARVYETITSQSSSSQSLSYNTRNQIRHDISKHEPPRFRNEHRSYNYDPKWTRNLKGVKKCQDDTPSPFTRIPPERTRNRNNFEKFNSTTTRDVKVEYQNVELSEKVAPTYDNHIAENRLSSVADNGCDVNTDSATTQIDEINEKDEEKSETDSGHNTGSVELCQRNSDLRSNLVELIREYPEGIWSVELLNFYRDKYGKDLNFERRGFVSVIALCRSLPDVFTVQRPDPFGDWLLMDASTPVTPSCRLRPPQPRNKTEFLYENEDALPGIDYDPSIYPSDCLHYLESIPRAELPEVDEDGLLEVIVSEVADPEHFWFQLRGKQHSVAMEAVMDEMAEYYIYGPGRVQFMVDGAMRVGQYCAACYQGDWHRAMIVQPLHRDKVKVRHVDYGTVERIHKSLVRPLPRSFASLAAQAVRGRLGGVRPAARALRWPHRTAQKLLALVSDKALVGVVQAVDVENQIVTMSLINTLGEEDIYIADELIDCGMAEAAPEAHNPGTFEIACAYPPFDALESGKALNYADRAALIRSGICPDDVEDCLDIGPKPPTLHSRNPIDHLVRETEQINEISKWANAYDEGNNQTINEEADNSEPESEIILGNDNYETLVDNSVAYNTSYDPMNSMFTQSSHQSQYGVHQKQYYTSTPNTMVHQMQYESQNSLHCPAAVHPYFQQFLYHQNVHNPYQVHQMNPHLTTQVPQNVAQTVQTPEVCRPTIEARVELSLTECDVLNNLLQTNPAMAQRYLDDKRSHSINTTLLQRQSASSTQSLNRDARPASQASAFMKPPPGYENVSLERRAQNTASNFQDSVVDVTGKMNGLVLNAFAGNKL